MLVYRLYRFPRFPSYCFISNCPFTDECNFPKKRRFYIHYCPYRYYKAQHPECVLPNYDSEGNIINE